MIPATVTFTDIAGLVRGASRGEGLGNRFLGHIREADATALVVRAFEDPDVTHVEGGVDPVRDIDVLELELQLADLETVTRRLERTEKSSRLQKEKEPETIALLHRVQEHLDQGRPVRTMSLNAEEQCGASRVLAAHRQTARGDRQRREVGGRRAGRRRRSSSAPPRRAATPSPSPRASRTTSPSWTPRDRAGFLHDLGLEEPGLHRVARSAYRLLRLITFFTAGDTEVRAWNLREGETALDAAASIHTDLARGFIRAEVTDAEELLDGGLVRRAA